MKSTGMIRDVDKVGRVVIPKEIRDTLGLAEGSPLEIFVENDTISLRKYTPSCLFCGSSEDLVSYEDRKICRNCIENLNTR